MPDFLTYYQILHDGDVYATYLDGDKNRAIAQMHVLLQELYEDSPQPIETFWDTRDEFMRVTDAKGYTSYYQDHGVKLVRVVLELS